MMAITTSSSISVNASAGSGRERHGSSSGLVAGTAKRRLRDADTIGRIESGRYGILCRIPSRLRKMGSTGRRL